MIQDLVVTFGKSNGGTHEWTYKELDSSISTPEIKEACELLTTLDIFEQNGVKLFDSVEKIKVLTHRERLIFDPEHDCSSETGQSNEPSCEEVHCFEVLEELPKTIPFNMMNKEILSGQGNYSEQLNHVKTGEHSDYSIKVEKASLKDQSQIVCKTQDRSSTPISDSLPPVEKVKEDNRLLLWIRRRRGKNKEDPASNQRE
ncbi:hypothetical protein KQI58_00680 [Enterococcus raffinosus]|uniref:hypothetical protein n=1 Tax=Enterococcus raffinosus TaxID=71452 RepID=UPI001C0FE9C6|nr:hypothetical protein [Enterococcus raffinosus]MBU5359586.1 hypothetical protein [Enterococcus raffinosus]